MFFDTHAHYDDEKFDEDRDIVLSSLPENGIDLVLNAASNIESAGKAVELAEKYDFIYAAAGVHPHDTEDMRDTDIDEIAKLCRHDKVKAIGEIGLDYHYDFSPRDVQISRFKEQMALAGDLSMPVIIHDREAHGDCLSVVRDIKVERGVYHCYSGSLSDAKTLVSLGYYLSFTGAITFSNAKKAYDIIRWMPLDRMMIETDCPYLAPVPNRGKRCDSRMLYLTAQKIAEIRGMTLSDIARITKDNGRKFFDIV